MGKTLLASGVLTFAAFVSSSHAATVISFDDLAAMTNAVQAASVPASADLSTRYLASNGIVFSSGAGYVAVGNISASAATSGTNAIAGTSSSNTVDYAHSLSFTFWNPANTSVPATTNFFSVRGDRDATGGGYSITMSALDLDGRVIATDTEIDSGGETWTFSVPGIHTVVFPGTPGNPYNGGIALDDVTFNPVVVPEPCANQLFALAGAAVRRRTRRGS